MKLRADQLAEALRKEWKAIYLITGDEPLLVTELCDLVRQQARKRGVEERLVFHAEAGFDWKSLHEEANAMSLFATQRLLEVRIPNGKPSDKGDTLKALLAQPSPDNTLLVICPRLDSATQNSAWFKAAEKHGDVVQVWPIERNQYPGWLRDRLQKAGIQADQMAVNLLAQQTEGNLLAAVQEIEKLRISGLGSITEEQLRTILGDSSRYDAFAFADACIEGDVRNASRILSHLRAEGQELIPVLGALVHKLHQLGQLIGLHGPALTNAFKECRIWQSQQRAFHRALERIDQPRLFGAIRLAADIDEAAKGRGDDPWRLLSELALYLCKKKHS